MNEAINKFRDAMKSLDKKDMEIVSSNLHKNNVRIERDIRFSLLMKEPQPTKRSYTSMRVGWD